MTGYQLRHSTVEEQEERAAAKAPYLHQKPERWRIIVGYVIIVLFIIFLPTQSAVINYLSLGKKYKRGFAIATVSLLASNVVLFLPTPPCWRNKKKNNEKKEEITEELGWTGEAAVTEIPAGEVVVKEIEAPEGELLSDRNKEEEGSDSNKESDVDFMAPQYQTSFRQNLLTLRLWCIAWTLFCLGGTEFVIINNPSYIYSAMARVETDTNMRTLLSVVSGVGSAVGRLFMAAFEHVSQHRPPEKRIPITWAPFIPMTLMTITLILFLTCPARLTPLPIVLTSFANGAQSVHTILLPRVIFAKDPARHYNFCFVPVVFSTILFVPFLWGMWYNKRAAETGGVRGYCFDRSCIMMPMGVLLGLVVSTALSSTYLHLHYTRYCRKVLAERRRSRGEMTSETSNTDG
ncbi:hypothetical protein AGDE_15795 [Angomonas deanei]|uniref:Uncharacterized protein n=1 Tax=Angomonas deanei TaxID=59799 RepID=A0A7G2CST3_9TRYP|nr:hypothetical protein AGDE_15795 [Angomonas deanei]CAD2221272.1 hypothetical protein, conserved [Angomonas deanei]|eukprot:EPY18396.1 hypothetical protein AGDE_15795 [Angomonas deanei]